MTTKKSDNAEIAVLQNQMETVIATVGRIEKKLDGQALAYVTKEDHTEDIAEIKSELAEIKGKRWIQNTLSAILGAVLSLLVAYFVANIGG